MTSVAEYLAERGWLPMPGWDNYISGANVGGISPYDGVPRWRIARDGDLAASAIALDAHAQEIAQPQQPAPVDDYGDGAEPVLIATFGDETPVAELAEAETQFVFGDNLATDRLVRQGQIAEHAQALISESRDLIGWDDAEYADLHSYVVSNLDKATGAFVGEHHVRYARFVTMSEVEARVRRIEAARDAKQAIIRDAGREAVATFDVSADWP